MRTIERKEGAGDFGRPPQPSAPRAKSLLATSTHKNLPVISNDVFQRLDPYHRALAEVFASHGEVIIEGMPQ